MKEKIKNSHFENLFLSFLTFPNLDKLVLKFKRFALILTFEIRNIFGLLVKSDFFFFSFIYSTCHKYLNRLFTISFDFET